jgi:hypothetical protein
MTNLTIKKVAFCGFAALAILVMGADLAHATNDFKGAVDNVGKQAAALPSFINFICYILGIGLVGKGILVGKKYSENPSSVNGGLLAVLGPVGVGGLLLVLPTVAEIAIQSTVGDGASAPTVKQGFSKTYQ